MARLDGMRTLVTGAASGIGRATAVRFAQDGAAAVTIVDRDGDGLAATADAVRAAGAQAVPVVADLAAWDANARAVETGLEAMGGIDVVVANAGIGVVVPFLEVTEETWRTIMSVNLDSGIATAQRAARAMVEQGTGGVVLFTTSIGGIGGAPGNMAYGAAKAGLMSVIRSMAIELGGHGIRVAGVAPGWVRTALTVAMIGQEAADAAFEAFEHAPLGRGAEPEEMASAFAFLASPDAAYVTGTQLVVDGGQTAWGYPRPRASTVPRD